MSASVELPLCPIWCVRCWRLHKPGPIPSILLLCCAGLPTQHWADGRSRHYSWLHQHIYICCLHTRKLLWACCCSFNTSAAVQLGIPVYVHAKHQHMHKLLTACPSYISDINSNTAPVCNVPVVHETDSSARSPLGFHPAAAAVAYTCVACSCECLGKYGGPVTLPCGALLLLCC